MPAMGKRVGGLYVDLRGDTDDFERDMSRARREMRQTEGSADSLASASHTLEGAFEATALAAAGLAVGLGALGMRFGPIEQQFARIAQNSEATDAQMQEMRDTAMQLGADLPSNMQDSANALYELTTAGLSASEATDALSGTTYLAIAGQLQMAEAASVTTTVLNAWGLQASKANAVADSLASTAAASATEVRDMGDAFTYASSTASELGVSSQELSSFIGVLSDAGMEASIAGTSINQALLSIVNPTGRAESALTKLGLTVSDLETQSGELKDMSEIIALLSSRLEGVSELERARILEDLFGLRGARAMGPLLSRAEKFNELMVESSQAEVLGGIERLDELSTGELERRRQRVGFALAPGSTQRVLEQFRQQARREGLSQEQLTARIAVGLNIEDDAARLLAGDLAGNTRMDALVQGIETANTAGKQARASMKTFAGQVEQFIGSMDTFFMSVYEGVGFALMPLLMVLNPIADVLAENKWAGRAFGVALVFLTGIAVSAATAFGVMAAEAWLMNARLATAMATTETYALLTGKLTLSQYAAAVSSGVLGTAVGGVTGALSSAAGAAYAFWASLGPIGWVILGLIGLFAAWKTGLLDWIGLGGEADAVINMIMWSLGGMADALGGVLGVGGGVLNFLSEFLGVAIKIAALPIVLPIKAAGVALRHFGNAADDALSPLEWLHGTITDTTQAVDWLGVALMSIPGIGMLYWLAKAAGHFGLVDDAIAGVTGPLEDFAYWAGYAGGILDALLSPAMDAAGDAAGWVGEKVDYVAGAFDRAADAANRFFAALDPRGEGQSWGDWLNPLPDNWGQQTGQKQRDVGRQAGRATTRGFERGTQSGKRDTERAMRQVTGWISGFLPSSDADRGPLSNLTSMGAALPETFATGARRGVGMAQQAGQTVATAARRAIQPAIGPDNMSPVGFAPLPTADRPSYPDRRLARPRAPSVSVDAAGGTTVNKTSAGTQIEISPSITIDGAGDGDRDVEKKVERIAKRNVDQLRRELETALFGYETGE